ncbi:MAG: polysaccharide export protein [Bacteroidota bacterium]|nr:polysaccharide export protein [Bacteroidota bacterium]
MRKSLIKRFCLFAAILYLPFMMTSCSSTQKIKYFQDIPDSGQLKIIATSNYVEPKIQVDDILTVLVETIDPQATNAINAGNVPSPALGSVISGGAVNNLTQQTAIGFLVNKEGFIEIPILGKIKVSGFTTSQVTEIVRTEAAKYYKDPTIMVRFANFKISVTGEVLRPGVYVLPNEKVTILDAIALAGDLTIFGKRENVLLIRENADGTKTPYRINLKKSDIMSSPYYYLRQNDVIYVEPRKAKSDATDAAQQKYIGIAAALLSLIIVLATRIK